MKIPVICYHKIDAPSPDARVRGGFTPPKRFARQLAYLKRAGFNFQTASELVEHFLEYGRFPANGIALTFDDGWRDNYTNALPILKRFGAKATIFLVSSCVGENSQKAVAEGEGPRRHLAREEILEMASHGIEFGSHTLNHRLLDRLGPEEVAVEVVEAKRQVENLLQKPCQVFAYPAGLYTEEARRIVREAGHIAAFTTDYGPQERADLFALNRTEILRRDRFLFQFARKVLPLRAST